MNAEERACDKLFSEIVRAAFTGHCALCWAKGKPTHPHHIISRREKRWRHVVLNAVALCPVCHRKAQEQETWFREWLAQNLPAHAVAAFHARLGPERREPYKPDYDTLLPLLRCMVQHGPPQRYVPHCWAHETD